MRTMSWSRYRCLCRSFMRIRMRLHGKRTATRPATRGFGLLRRLFLGIISTWSGSARSIAVDPPEAALVIVDKNLVATGRHIPNRRCEMKHLPSIVELREKLGSPSSETVETVRLLRAFLKLAPRQRFEVIELVEQLAIDPGPDRRSS